MTPDHWIAVGGVAASGLISWIVSRYFYRRSDKRRTPTFVVRPQRTILVSPEITSTRIMTVLPGHDGEIGNGGITKAQIYFWNSGTLPILSDDVLEPFGIKCPGEVLDQKIIKSSRAVIGLEASVGDIDKRCLTLKFAVLEPGDGASIEIVYDGPPDREFEFAGACVGAAKPTVLPPDNIYFSSVLSRLSDPSTSILALVVLSFGPILAVIGVGWLIKRFFGEHVASILGAVLIGVFIIVLALAILTAAWDQYTKIKAPYLPPDVRS